MRRRLFWKILLGFWLLLILVNQGMWTLFSLYADRPEPFSHNIARRIVNLQMNAAITALQQGGRPAIEHLIASWPEHERHYLTFIDEKSAGQNVRGRSLASFNAEETEHEKAPPLREKREFVPFPKLLTATVSGADGIDYQLRYDLDALEQEYQPKRRFDFLNMPPPMLILGAIVGLLFSALLAWNLTRPMRQLRAGFEHVAQGDLSVRLFPRMRRRHDELSDLARDFDSMVERLDRLVSSREELLHDVSHELRSPLARIQLAIGLMRQNSGNTESAVKRIEQEAERMDTMIEELLTLSRTHATTLPDEEYFDLYGLVSAIVNDVRYEAQVPGVRILFNADPVLETQGATIKGNAELMRRAVENIVRNALRFSRRGQEIEVTLQQNNQALQIEVKDSGPGVEESQLSSIFDPFVRVNSPESGKGYGLGLAIARKVVHAHQGTIEARNRQGRGLAIVLRIPMWGQVEA